MHRAKTQKLRKEERKNQLDVNYGLQQTGRLSMCMPSKEEKRAQVMPLDVSPYPHRTRTIDDDLFALNDAVLFIGIKESCLKRQLNQHVL